MTTEAGLSKRLRIAGEMQKVTGEIFWCVSASVLHTFREAGTFIRVDSEMHGLPAYFDSDANVAMS